MRGLNAVCAIREDRPSSVHLKKRIIWKPCAHRPRPVSAVQACVAYRNVIDAGAECIRGATSVASAESVHFRYEPTGADRDLEGPWNAGRFREVHENLGRRGVLDPDLLMLDIWLVSVRNFFSFSTNPVITSDV